jgi:carbon monoxide dehydrogenase subunit G
MKNVQKETRKICIYGTGGIGGFFGGKMAYKIQKDQNKELEIYFEKIRHAILPLIKCLLIM